MSTQETVCRRQGCCPRPVHSNSAQLQFLIRQTLVMRCGAGLLQGLNEIIQEKCHCQAQHITRVDNQGVRVLTESVQCFTTHGGSAHLCHPCAFNE